MPSPAPTVYVISGASRGIGFAITSLLAQRDNLDELAQKSGGKAIPVKLEATSVDDNDAVAKSVEEKAGKVDYVLAVAGISPVNGPRRQDAPRRRQTPFRGEHNRPARSLSSAPDPPHQVDRSALRRHLFHRRLYCIDAQVTYPVSAYAISKTAVNGLVGRIAAEHPELDAFVCHPGVVSSDMVKEFVKKTGGSVSDIPEVITPEESAAGLVKLFDEAKKKTHSGKFFNVDGAISPW